MHIDELMDVAVGVHFHKGAAQLAQGVGPQGRETEQPGRREYSTEFREHGVRLAPLQHEIAENQVDAAAGEGKPLGRGLHTREAAQ